MTGYVTRNEIACKSFAKINKTKERIIKMKYLIVKCNELRDQFECDADRTPICLTNDYSKYDKRGYEIYEIQKDNTFKLIRDYEDVTNEEIVIAIYSSEAEYTDNPNEVIPIIKGDRTKVDNSLIEKIKKQFHFSNPIDDIFTDISCLGSHGEYVEDKWVVFGESFDDEYPRGY